MKQAIALSLEEARENSHEEKANLLVKSEGGEENAKEKEDDDEELLRQAIALSLED